MQLTDTHCHLDFPDYKDDLEEVLSRASGAGVVRIIVPGTSISSSQKAIELARKHPNIYAACGVHPHEADKVTDPDMAELREMAAKDEKIVAIGEIGLDYYRKFSKIENQKKLFNNCLDIAKEFDLPVILHNREAGEDFLKVLKGYDLKGVVHCFSQDERLLEELLERGFYISFAGNITYPKASKLRELAGKVPIERILLETDSPYISPEPVRGKRNEPVNVKYLVSIYSEIYSLSKGDIARITTHNANELFSLGLEEKGMIAYPIRNSLYLNITSRCTNKCTFCIRNSSNFVKGHKLRLDRDPSVREIISSLGDISVYDEIVFCGYGEPTLRLDVIKEIASYVKEKGGKVRLVTNGEGDLINERPIVPELKGLIDRVSVSLNAPEAGLYDRICQSVFGTKAYDAILNFLKDCRNNSIEVEITCLDFVGEDDVNRCRKIAEEIGATFRLRHLNVVG